MLAIIFIFAPFIAILSIFILTGLISAITWFINFSCRINLKYPYEYNFIKTYFEKIIVMWLLFSAIFMIVSLIILITLGIHPGATISLKWLSLFLMPCIPYITRFIIDVCRSLKINHKTGVSARIAKLEQEILSLKEKTKE